MITVLVTGATGTVGSAACDALAGARAGWPAVNGGVVDAASEGGDARPTRARRPVPPVPALSGVGGDVRVRAAVRDPSASPTVPADEFVGFDFDRPETWGDALADVDAAFLLYPPGVAVDRVREVADAAARVGVDRLALLSVLHAGDVPVLPHRRLERHLAGLAADGGPVWTALRAGYFYQNLAGFHAPEVRERDAVFVPAGDAATAMVDARDVGAAAAVVLTAGGATTDAAGHDGRASELTDAAHTYREVAGALSDALDRPIRYANPSLRAFVRAMRRRDVSTGMVAFTAAEYAVAKYGLLPVDRTSGDLSTLLGRPPTSLATFVADYRDVYVWEPTGREGDDAGEGT
jgi:uncharacterized protein YbjT (DUF2867 family)